MHVKYALICFCIVLHQGVSAQSKGQSKASSIEVYEYVEQMPEAGYDYMGILGKVICPDIDTNTQLPSLKVIIKFIVNEDGHISDCKIIHSGLCDTEFVRIIEHFPPWKPGRKNGKPVKVWFVLPIYIDPG